MQFKLSVKPGREVKEDIAYFFVFNKNQLLLVYEEEEYRIPGKRDLI